ncbi:divalent-cation tolerance protein CutA [Candidatus Woesearchaeota archaeon CG_4_10_14_0_8_um_filter_47_5]|nr:MAG: divalent-cation tolerance protein CutA [Candidatus Woesearchaeota archaeon CG_4_10_14_0_8_um_filter_47_5]
MRILYVTCQDKREAEEIAKKLLEEKLIACANYFPITSLYTWKDELVTGNEYVLLLKTFKKHTETIKVLIEEMHSYECPCIVEIEMKANAPFASWMHEVIRE